MGEHRVSSGPPGRQSLTFSADETLEDGSTVRTLETPAATIRFCFIDNVSSDSDSEEVAGNVDDWKPPDVTPNFVSLSNSGERSDGPSESEKCPDGVDMDSAKQKKEQNDNIGGDAKSETREASAGTTVFLSDSSGESDSYSNSVPEDKEPKFSAVEEETLVAHPAVDPLPKVGALTLHDVNDSKESSQVQVDDRFTNSNIKVELAVNHGFVKEHSPSPEKSFASSDPRSVGTTSSSSSSPSMPQRFNPFDRDVFVEEDHFSLDGSLLKGNKNHGSRQSLPNVMSPDESRARANSDDYPRSVSSDDSGYLAKDENDITFADLGLAEDHFSQPEGYFGLSTTEELELAIESCKEMIMEAGENLERKKNLVSKLVQLRIRLQDAKDGPEESLLEADAKLVLGHKFKKKETGRSKHYCEKCNNVIWGMLQVWYRCAECGFCCHGKCLNLITRMCASVKVHECPLYILTICPEKGLAAQQYRCAECRTVIAFKSNFDEPRQCDYTGNYYCEQCHWNDTMIIPARVMHNWDFEPMKVCRASKQFLKLMMKRSVLRIQDINPMLFSYIEELNEIKKLREEILVMKKYFLSCQDALASKLLLQLRDRQHFVDNSDMYSMQDLLDAASDDLVPKLTKIHASFAQHIKADCELCQGKGFICELCDSQEILFPFDNHAIVCSQCSAVLHRHCYMRRANMCPRCDRRNKRAAEEKES